MRESRERERHGEKNAMLTMLSKMGSECQWESENTFCILQLAVPKRPALLPPGHSGSHQTLRSPTMWAWHGMATCPPKNCLINEQMIKHGTEWMIPDFKRHPHHHIYILYNIYIYIIYINIYIYYIYIYIISIYTVPVPYINSIAHMLLFCWNLLNPWSGREVGLPSTGSPLGRSACRVRGHAWSHHTNARDTVYLPTWTLDAIFRANSC